MNYKNLSPFPSLSFQALNVQEEEFHVVVLRTTLTIQPDGHMELATKQNPLVFRDEFFGELNKSSLKYESDLAPHKPWCDVIIHGTAQAPGRHPMKRFDAGIRISRKGESVLNKLVTITGPRYWSRGFLGRWKLTEPKPIRSLPLRYEYAYGGECRIENTEKVSRKIKRKHQLTAEQRVQHPEGSARAPIAHSCASTNPVGQGFATPWYLRAKGLRRLPAPQIESPIDPIQKFQRPYAPQNLGIIGRSWTPRVHLAGTIDPAFVKSGRRLPQDFDFAYWNGAHPDLQTPWLKGNETIDLINIPVSGLSVNRLDSQGNQITRLTLPGHMMYLLAYYFSGEIFPVPMNIDTLIIEPDEKQVTVVWRAWLACEPKIHTLETRWADSNNQRLQLALRDYREASHG